MRSAFIEDLLVEAKKDSRIWLLTGDLGFNVLDQFKDAVSSRFINVGIAEQNMCGLATGLALSGDRQVFIYSIANFPTLRCLEQIRNDICYHKAEVKIISVGAGVAYGTHGYSHFGLEDIGIMRTLPNIKIICPADPVEAKAAVKFSLHNSGPVYIRLGKNGEPRLHATNPDISRIAKLREGNVIKILATGAILEQALKASHLLSESHNLEIGCYSCPVLKPFDISGFKQIIEDCKIIVSLEEHGPVGGLSSIISEFLAEMAPRIKLIKLHLPELVNQIGKQSFILNHYGLDATGISKAILRAIDPLQD